MKKNENDTKQNGEKRQKIEGDNELDYSITPHQGKLDPFSLKISDAFKTLRESKIKKESFPSYKFDEHDFLTGPEYCTFISRAYAACLQLSHTKETKSRNMFSIVSLQNNVAMYVQKIEEWHRNNNVDYYTLHTFHCYGTACSLIASKNFHCKDLQAKHFSYYIKGSKDNKDVMDALMMLLNPFFERRTSKSIN